MLASSGPDDRYRGDRPADPKAAYGRPLAGAPKPGGPGGPGGPRPARGSGGPAKSAPGPAKGAPGSVKDRARTGRDRPGPDRKRRPAPDPGPPPAPVRRFLSLTIAGFSLLLGFGLVIGSQATQIGFTIVIVGAQVLFVLAWTVASRPPNPWVPGVVGILTTAASAVAVNWPVQASITPLGYVIAGGFAAAVIGQLALRGGRAGVTESLGVTMVVVVGVTAFASLGVLSRQPLGGQVLLAGLVATGTGLGVARICDVIAPTPRITPAVPRGSTGVVAGAMIGTAAAAEAGRLVDGLSTFDGAIAGMVAVLVAVVVDLGTGYAEAGRRLEGEAPFMWLARHMQGPLGAFAFAAPISYVVGVILR